MPKGQKPRPRSVVTRGTWLDRESMNDLVPRTNLPESSIYGPAKQPKLNPALDAAVKRGAIRKD